MRNNRYLKLGVQLLIGFLFFSCNSTSEKKTSITMEKKQPEVKAPEKPVQTYFLESPAREDWEKIDIVFLHNVFEPFLVKHNLRQDCIQCENIYFEYNCLIDKEGKMTEISLQHTSVYCKGMTEQLKKEMEEMFLKYYQETIYSESLRGMRISFRVGRATKC
jgi:hypothetical protein